jgi:predicted alpha/beta hydrolase
LVTVGIGMATEAASTAQKGKSMHVNQEASRAEKMTAKGAREPSPKPVSEAIVVTTADGFRLPMRIFVADEAARGPSGESVLALVAPAMGAKQSFYAPFARWLASHGITAVTFDYRGLGEARGEGESETQKVQHATIPTWARQDAAAVLAELSERYPSHRFVWIGHSVSAQIFGLIPGHQRVSKMLSVAAGSGYYRHNARPLRYYAPFLWHVAMPLAIRFGAKRLKLMRLITDLPPKVSEQWRTWCMHPKYLGCEDDLAREVAASTVPIHALSFNDDEMMSYEGTRALFALYQGTKVTIERVEAKRFARKTIGHFGFYRPASGDEPLWQWAKEWILQGE